MTTIRTKDGTQIHYNGLAESCSLEPWPTAEGGRLERHAQKSGQGGSVRIHQDVNRGDRILRRWVEAVNT
jgi:hypothetical protein